MLAINVRRLLVYLATGAFFAVAALGQVHGDSAVDAFLKAGAACAVVVVLGRALVHLVDSAEKKAATAAVKTVRKAAAGPAEPGAAQ